MIVLVPSTKSTLSTSPTVPNIVQSLILNGKAKPFLPNTSNKVSGDYRLVVCRVLT